MTKDLSVIIGQEKNKKRLKGFSSLDEIELIINYLKAEYPYATIHIVNHKNAIAPQSTDLLGEKAMKIKGKLWCPYCGDYRIYNLWYEYRRCSVCQVSTEDFYTKKYNDLNEERDVAQRPKKRKRKRR